MTNRGVATITAESRDSAEWALKVWRAGHPERRVVQVAEGVTKRGIEVTVTWEEA